MTEWLIPCNPEYYDIENAFNKLDKLDWKQSNKNIDVNDIVYIYIGSPVKAIVYKCRVNKVNLSAIEIDDSEFIINTANYRPYERYMEIEIVRTYNRNILSFDNLRSMGLNGSIRCTRKVNPELSVYLETLI